MSLPKELTTVTVVSRTVELIVLIAAMIIGFGLGVNYQETIDLLKQQNNSVQATIIKPTTPIYDETASWKTYTNTEIGFSFQYPQELNYIYDDNMKDVRTRKTGQLLIQNYDDSKPVDSKDSLKIQIHLTIGKDMVLSLEQHINNQQNLMREYGKTLPSLREIMVDNERAFKGGTIQKGELVPIVWFKHKEFDYTLVISPETFSNVRLLDQILSTFKFTQ